MELAKLKPFGWGAVVGAVLLLIIMFSTGWVVTSSNAQQQAEQKAEQAVDRELAQICAYQFKQANKTQQKLQEMAEMEYNWDRAEYIREHNWATMPGEDSSSSGVADNCAKRIMEQYDKDE